MREESQKDPSFLSKRRSMIDLTDLFHLEKKPSECIEPELDESLAFHRILVLDLIRSSQIRSESHSMLVDRKFKSFLKS